MDNDKINNNNYEKKNATDIRKSPIDLKKLISHKFHTTLINQKSSKNVSINKLSNIKKNKINSQKDLRKSQKNLGLSLYDSLYLGGHDINNNKGIRANDISCYLSNTSMYQPEETKYRLIEKNIQNKLLNLSMEIFEKTRSKFGSELSNNESFKKKKGKKKKINSNKKNNRYSIKDKSQKLKLNHKFIPLQKTLSLRSHENSTLIMIREQQIEKNRKIIKKKVLYDSMAEDESDENIEEEGFGLSPESLLFDVYDSILLICSLFSLFYVPLRLAKTKLLIDDEEYIILMMIHFSEIIYIFDLIFGFFRWYYNNELKLVKNNSMVMKNYLLGHFITDLIEAIPFYTILKYLYLNKDENNSSQILFNETHFFLKIFTCFKALKIFKINNRKNNRAFYLFSQKASDNYSSERFYQISVFSITIISVLNIFICFHIYMAKLSYPNWILSSKLQDKPFIEIYLASLYFILATMTSVGYGDIVCISKEETIYQIILLTIGIVAYSWIISTVGDYVKNESRATIKYNKDVLQLEEIRISYPNMPFKLYNKIHQHLERLVKQQEKYDSNLLINSLPYNLKNTLIFEIHKEVITKFIFFNGCENSDFILKIITHFIPLYSKKNVFLIKEGEIIENIFFVKDGRLALEAAIDLDNIEESVERYLKYQFEGISSIVESEFENSIQKIINEDKIVEKNPKIKNYKDLFNFINKQTKNIGDVSYMHESHIEEEIGKCDLNGEMEDIDISNFQFLHILDILKNEHFGELYMLLNKPCPLSLRVKSKKVDLFLLRKKDASSIRKDYPNIWKRIDDKAMHNMKSIKALTKKVVNKYCILNGILQEKEADQRSDHLFGFNEPENENKEKSTRKNTSSNNKENTSYKFKSKNSIKNKMSIHSTRNSEVLNIFSPKKNPQKTNTFKLFGGGNFLNKSKNQSLIEIKTSFKNIKRMSKSNVLNRKESLMLKSKIVDEEKLENKAKKKIKKGKSMNCKQSFLNELNKTSSLSFSQSDKSINQKLNKSNSENQNRNKNNIPQEEKEAPKNIEENTKTETQNIPSYHHFHHNFNNVKNKSSFNNILFQLSKIQEQPHVNCQVSSTTFSTKNVYNNLVNIFDNKNQNINQNVHQNINQINNFNNNLTNYNNLVIANTNLLCQIPEMPTGKDGNYSITKCDCVFCNPSKLIKESIVKFEILSSYKNINIITKGNYLNNEKFQKAAYKFFNYYISSSPLQGNENISNTEEKDSSYDLSSFNPYSQEESMIDKKYSKNTNFLKINSDTKQKSSKNKKGAKSDKDYKNDEKGFVNKKKSIKNMNTERINKNKLNLYLDTEGKNNMISDSKNSCFIKSRNYSKVSEVSKTENKIIEKNYINILEEENNNNNSSVYNADLEEHNKNNNSEMISENANKSYGKKFLSKKIKKTQSKKENNVNIRRSFSKSIKRVKTNKSIVESNDNNNYKFCLIY